MEATQSTTPDMPEVPRQQVLFLLWCPYSPAGNMLMTSTFITSNICPKQSELYLREGGHEYFPAVINHIPLPVTYINAALHNL
jgi:hypothetical protein